MTPILTIAQTVWRGILRRKDLYVLLILLIAVLVVLVSLDMFGISGVVRYVQDAGLFFTWLFGWILAVNLSSRELPEEERSRTIFPLLAKPITRLELVVGKWLGTWSVISVATLVFYVMVLGIVAGKGGHLSIPMLLQAWLLHCGVLAMICALGTALSTRMHHDAAATLSYIFTAAIFLVVPRVPEFLTSARGFAGGAMMFIYNALPHFEILDLRQRLVHDLGSLDWGTFAILACYAALWTALILLVGWMAYRNKRFNRGNA